MKAITKNPLQNEPYRRWVSERDCEHCGRPGPSRAVAAQFGHPASDTAIFALCADDPGRRGCGSIIASKLFTPEQRRTLEAQYVTRTQLEAKMAGAWPREWAQ
jgi:hypothetical protein